MHKPLLTIICISKNNYSGISKTFYSISSSTLINKRDISILQMDKSEDCLKSYEIGKEFLSGFEYKFHRQKSSGIFNAFNESINLVNSEYIYFLNTGDIFFDKNSLKLILNECISKERPNIIYFDIYKKNSDNLEIKKSSNNLYKCLKPFATEFPSHQACIFKTTEHRKILYPEFFGADEFVIRLFLKKGLSTPSCKYIPHGICIFDLQGISSLSKISFKEFIKRSFGYLIMFLPHRILSDFIKIFPFYFFRKRLLLFLFKLKK